VLTPLHRVVADLAATTLIDFFQLPLEALLKPLDSSLVREYTRAAQGRR
jgi:hypothetical protein